MKVKCQELIFFVRTESLPLQKNVKLERDLIMKREERVFKLNDFLFC